jgi:hypothetical protein
VEGSEEMEQLELGLSLKARGQAQALRGAGAWHEEALKWLSEAYGDFSADDLIENIGLPHDIAMNKNNAVGAAFTAARRIGLIRRVGWTQSRRPEGHGRVIALWSKI